MPVRKTNDNLCGTLDALDAAGVLPQIPPPVRTLEGAKRRLGLEPDDFIIQYAICPICWKHYSPQELEDMDSSACEATYCDGRIYQELDTAKGDKKRRAFKIIPHVSLIQQLRRIMRRKGMRKHIRDSRTPQQNGGNDSDDFIMTDMHDGKMWEDMHTGIQREVGDLGTVRDETVPGETRKQLSQYRFGLHLVVNMDWYVHSVVFQLMRCILIRLV